MIGAVLAAAGDLLIGSTVLLGSGVVATLLARAPVHRQRLAELSVVATVAWLALATVPMPRLGWEERGFDARVDVAREGADARTRRAVGAVVPHAGEATMPASGAADGLRRGVRSASPGRSGPGSIGSDSGEESGAEVHTAGAASRIGSGITEPPPRPWWLAFGLAYAAGAAIVAGYTLLGFLLVRRLLSRSAPPPAWLEALFQARCIALGVRRVRLRVTRAPCRPLSAGVINPTVVVPAVLLDPTRGAALRRLLDHELVHIRRGDVLGRVLFAAVASLLWFHPLFWWLRSRAALAAELIADDGAAAGDGRYAYATGLLRLAEELEALRSPPGLAPGTFRTRSELTRRIEMLTRSNDRLATACSARRTIAQCAAATIALVACTAAFGVQPLPGQNPAVESGAAPAVNAPSIGVQPDAARAREGVPDPAAALGSAEDAPRPRDTADAAGSAPRIGVRMTQAQNPDPAYAATLALVNQAITLQSELELARAEFDRTTDLREQSLITEQEFRKAMVALETTQRRFEAVRILIQAEIDATRIELAQLTHSITLGTAPASAEATRVRLAARLRVLESVS